MSFLGGVDWVTVQAALHSWVVTGTGLAAEKVVWGQQDAPRPEAPAVVMRLSNLSESGTTWVWLDTEGKALSFATKTITAIDTVANTLTCVGHGLLTGDGPVRISSTGTLPAPLQANTDYWVIKVDDDTFKLATSYANTGGGQGSGNPITPIDLTSTGSGTITLDATTSTLRAGEELSALARGYLKATLELVCHSSAAVGLEMATSLLQRIRTRSRLPSQIQKLQDANIGLIDCDRVRALHGVRDSFLFEPRAFLDVHLNIPVEEAENITIIETVELTNTTTGVVFNVPDV